MDKREVFDAVRNVTRGIGRKSLDIVLPPQDPFRLHQTDWKDVRFIDEPCCATCGFPFEYDMGAGSLCGDCLIHPPRYDRARSAMIYDDASRPLILAFKHGGKTQNLGKFAAQLRRVGGEALSQADFIVPVPLHDTRRIARRYNQSALLARALGKISQPRFDPNTLRRVRATPSQGGMSAAGRRRNVKGAFAVMDAAKARLKNSHIILIDDVMTTGATVQACASLLRRTGAKRVDVLCLARVVRTDISKKD